MAVAKKLFVSWGFTAYPNQKAPITPRMLMVL